MYSPIHAVRALLPDAAVTALGTPKGLEGRLVPERGYPLEMIPPVPLPRKPGKDLAKLPFTLTGAVRRTRKLARKKAQREGLLPAPKKKPLPGRAK